MKKLISLILTVILMTGVIPSNSVFAEEVDSLLHEKELLTALGVLNDEALAEDLVLTRGEFCELIYRLFKYESFTTQQMPFRDINDTHPHFASISALYAKGAIKGINTYSVAPDRKITLEEAGIVAVSALGFGIGSDIDVSFFISQITSSDLYQGISASQNDGLTEDMAIKLIYNILFAPIVESQIGKTGIEYTTNKNVTMMNRVHDLYEVKGVMNDNGITNLYGPSTLNENELKINDTEYTKNYSEVEDLLGCSVKAYAQYKDERELGVILYAYMDERKTTVVEISSMDIISATKAEVKYDSDAKTKKIKLNSSADLIYNGIGSKDFTDEKLNPTYGVLKLIDNDGDGSADVVFVTDYKRLIVQSVSSRQSDISISDKFGNDFSAVLSDINCEINVWRNGILGSLNDLKSGMVILIADSGVNRELQIINIYIYAEKHSGLLRGINDEQVFLEDKTIETTPFVDVSATAGYTGNKVACYTDIYGRVIYVEIDTVTLSDTQYGFLYKMSYDDSDETVTIKVLETNNEKKTYILADKVRCNADRMKAVELYNKMSGVDDGVPGQNNEVPGQMIRYALNSDGEISTLDTAMIYEDEKGRADRVMDEMWRDKGYFRKSMAYNQRRFAHNTKGMFEGKGYGHWVECFFTTTVPVLIRPDGANFDIEDARWTTNAYFLTDGDYYCEGFDLNENNSISLMMVYADTSLTVTVRDPFVLVDKIVTELDEDDMPVTKLYGWMSGNYIGFTALKDTAFNYNGSILKRGDIVRLAKNTKNEVEKVEANSLLFRLDKNPEAYFTDGEASYNASEGPSNVAYGYYQRTVGRVTKVYSDYLRVTGQDTRWINVMLRSAANIVVYDSKNSKNPIYKGSVKDLAVGDIVVVHQYFGRLDNIIIYK